MDDVAIARAQDLTGAVLGGRYEVLGKLGVGGMASVYEGRRVGLHNRVAIKILRSELCEDPTNVKRFLREARASSVIEHENIVDILDFGHTDALPVYFVMEFLEGNDLRKEIKQRGPMKWPRARQILLQIVSALAAAHNKSIVHRDVKPANIFLIRRPNGEEFVKVLDFGIAKVIEDTLGGLTHGHTMTNGLLGTVAYMAPEQARGETIDARTDIYATGVVAYQMMTGRVPFKGSNPFMVLEQHVNERPVPPRQRIEDIPAEAETIILRCLEKDPADRYASMAELAEVIEHAHTMDYVPRAPVIKAAPVPTPAPVAPAPDPTPPPITAQYSASPPPAAPPASPAAPPVAWSTPAPQSIAGDRVGPVPHPTEALGSGSSYRAPASAPRQGTGPAAAMVTGNTQQLPPGRSGATPNTHVGTTLTPPAPARVTISAGTTKKTRRARPAFFGVGLGVGILAAVGLSMFFMRPTEPAPRDVPGETPAAAAATIGPSPVATPPSAAVPVPAPPKPEPTAVEIVDARPKEQPPVVVPPPSDDSPGVVDDRPPPQSASPRRRKSKKRRSKPAAPAASTSAPADRPAKPEPPRPEPPVEEPDSDIHPDLKTPYG